MLVRSDLWEAVALGIDAENRKIDIFIHHNLSRGIAREALLRSILVQHTPCPYRVRSGFVYTDNHKIAPHKQCDVLVYDPRASQPYYQIDEFIVAEPHATALIAEVKSTIGDSEFSDIREMQAYAVGIGKPLLGFVYEGWLFDTFCDKMRAYAADMSTLPICLVVHTKNYLAIRPTKPVEPICLLIDFSQSSPALPGMATAYFFNVYDILTRSAALIDPADALLEGPLLAWLQDVLTIVPAHAKKWLTQDGVLHSMAERARPR